MSLVRKVSVAARKREIWWRYAFNLAPTLAWRFRPFQLGEEASRVLEGLNRDGIALTSAKALLGRRSLYGELERAVAELETRQAPELAELRKAANNAEVGKKTFIRQLLGQRPLLDHSSIFARFALQDGILETINAYFGMYTRLREYNVWYTFVSTAPARESQLWHRDREDRLIAKVFVYLSDVDEGAGPLTYAPGTHQKGPIRREPESFKEGGVHRSSDEQMARVVPREKWIQAVGRKGSIVFADTRGYHKGGHARERGRLMYTCHFTSPASEAQEVMVRHATAPASPDRARMVAMSPPRGRLWLTLPSPQR